MTRTMIIIAIILILCVSRKGGRNKLNNIEVPDLYYIKVLHYCRYSVTFLCNTLRVVTLNNKFQQ